MDGIHAQRGNYNSEGSFISWCTNYLHYSNRIWKIETPYLPEDSQTHKSLGRIQLLFWQMFCMRIRPASPAGVMFWHTNNSESSGRQREAIEVSISTNLNLYNWLLGIHQGEKTADLEKKEEFTNPFLTMAQNTSLW